MLIRKNYALVPFVILTVLMFANAVLKQFFIKNWADPITECIFIYFVPYIYCVVASIIYNDNKPTRTNIITCLVLFISFLVITLIDIFSLWQSQNRFINSGVLGIDAVYALFSLSAGIVLITYLIKAHTNKKQNALGDNSGNKDTPN